jgi:tetratricopeptide (TPR) repeat protein
MRALMFGFAFLLSATAQTLSPVVPREIQTLLAEKNYQDAEQAIRAELDRRPGWDMGHFLLAQIYNATGRYELAERAGLAAFRVHESLDALLALAVADMNLRKLNESIAWLDKAAKLRPDSAEIYRVLGLDYALGGMMLESEKAFQRAVTLAPGNWETHYLDGRALYELEKFPEARRALEGAAGRNPQSVKIWTALGQVEDRLGNAAAAEASYRKALQLCGDGARECAWPLLELGFLAGRQTRDDAERYFRQAVAARPDWAKPHFYLGKALAAEGDLSGARVELEAAAQLEPDQSQHQYQLAQLYRRMGEVAQSEKRMLRYRQLIANQKKAAPELHVP